MDKMVIEGGARLNGKVRISGSKNAALPLIASAILAQGRLVLTNVPNLRDIRTMIALMKHMGADVDFSGDRLEIKADTLNSLEAPYELVKTMRASSMVLGPLAARYGSARVSLPGGCAIGERPINFHLAALECMGARIDLEHGYVKAGNA